ncbi:acyl-CoA thioester hydrolase [Paenacidovorax caeni]|uniref:Acyl-CoA thioester hydrolase n=1 Tax=Paenacidovorax caeni TaxID=343013 RepID=A0A1I7KMS2_9BURK|nr:acyl-CoA thioesterase [Paenacidovorax caeni]SFU98757.1 acyl-CoA thioester hydrolase [Paenacidovorax caeni]
MRIEIPERKKLVYEMRFAVRWGEMDAMGHVNNTVYFRYLENARIAWMEAIGCHPDPRGEGLVIVNAFCNFYRQLEFPSEVLLKLYVSDPGRTTFDTWGTMERLDQPGEICAAGGATMIWVDFPQQKAKTLPDWMRALVTMD